VKRLTLDSKSDVGSERFGGHLVGRGTPVDGVVIRRLDGKYELVLSAAASTDVREVQLSAVAIPVDLSQRIAATRHADQACSVTRLQHLAARVAADFWLTGRICSHAILQHTYAGTCSIRHVHIFLSKSAPF